MYKNLMRISKVSSNTESDYISISFQDKNSNVTFLVCELSLEDFAQVITGKNVEVVSKYNFENVGKIRELKTEVIHTLTFGEVPGTILKEFEIDGWKANQKQIEDTTRYFKSGNVWAIRVDMVRYVNHEGVHND